MTHTKDAALKLALEALQWSKPHKDAVITHGEAIAALVAALAQPAPVQEPVGVFVEDDDIGHVRLIPHQQLKLKDGDEIYTTPQQRKPMTVDEVWQNDQLMSLNAEIGCSMDLLIEVVEAVEAAHGIKEKNT